MLILCWKKSNSGNFEIHLKTTMKPKDLIHLAIIQPRNDLNRSPEQIETGDLIYFFFKSNLYKGTKKGFNRFG